MLHFIHMLLFAVYFTVLTKQQQGSQAWRTEAPKFKTSQGRLAQTSLRQGHEGVVSPPCARHKFELIETVFGPVTSSGLESMIS